MWKNPCFRQAIADEGRPGAGFSMAKAKTGRVFELSVLLDRVNG
jgi:hypothetical protein